MSRSAQDSDGGPCQYEFRDVLSGDYTEATANSESTARTVAAQKIDADPSDLRRIHDHSDRKPEDTEEAKQVLKDALGDDHDV